MEFSEFIKACESFEGYEVHKKLVGCNQTQYDRIKQELEGNVSAELDIYLRKMVPREIMHFYAYGNDIKLFSDDKLSVSQEMYSYDKRINNPFSNWKNSWFLLAGQYLDPFVYDLVNGGVYFSYHGFNKWEFRKIAKDIPQFLTCICLFDYVITKYTYHDFTFEDEDGNVFMKQEAAEIVFPFLRKYANDYFDYWSEEYANAEDY